MDTSEHKSFVKIYAFSKHYFKNHKAEVKRNEAIIKSYSARRNLQETCADPRIRMDDLEVYCYVGLNLTW